MLAGFSGASAVFDYPTDQLSGPARGHILVVTADG